MLVVPIRRDVVVQLSGILDVHEDLAFNQCVARLLADAPRRLVLELSSLSGIDRAGAECFTHALLAAKAHDVDLVLDSPNNQVLSMLESEATGNGFFIR